MERKLRALYEKHGEILRYLVIGGITTGIDIAVFALCTDVLGMAYAWAKVIATVLAVSFAFVGNKWVVFRSRTEGGRALLREAARFAAMRVLTLLFAEGFLYVAIDLWLWNGNVANILCNVAVIALNYVLSRLFVFRTGGRRGGQ